MDSFLVEDSARHENQQYSHQTAELLDVVEILEHGRVLTAEERKKAEEKKSDADDIVTDKRGKADDGEERSAGPTPDAAEHNASPSSDIPTESADKQ